MSNYIFYNIIYSYGKWENDVITFYNNWFIIIRFYDIYIRTKTISC